MGHRALVIGASGGIGQAFVDVMSASPHFQSVATLSRRDDGLDIVDESSVAAAAAQLAASGACFDLIIDATGALEIGGAKPENSMRRWSAETMIQAMAVNVVGPAMLMRYFLPLLDSGKKVGFATLSARVGSIGDNRLGGWASYRASKAALNQVVRCAAIEVARKRPAAVVVALHPGTVETDMTRRYARGRYTHTPTVAAQRMLAVMDGLQPSDSGGFFAYDGSTIPW